MIWKPNVVVAAVIERDGRFLMVEEESDEGLVFNQPAGHLDEGEDLMHAVCREVMEETAWQFEPHALLGLYLWPHPRGDTTYLRVCFTGDCKAHDPTKTLDTGIIRAAWLTREELVHEHARLRSPLVLRCIDDYLAGRRYPIDILHYLPAGASSPSGSEIKS